MKPGAYDTTMDEYLALPAFSSGLAHTLTDYSPLHAWTESSLNPQRVRRDSKTMDLGTYAHACLLEGGTDKLCVCEFTDWKKKAAQEIRDAARARGLLPILVAKVDEVEAMVAAAKAYIATSEIAGIFDDGKAEQTLVWNQDGVLCKARADWLTGDRKVCLSYKTTAGSANPDIWSRTQLPSYDMATVFYEWAVQAVYPDAAEPVCVHLVQEQARPFACSLVALSPALADLAQRKLRAAIAAWRACVERNNFPAYPTRICWAEPLPWQQAQFEEKEMREHIFPPRSEFTTEELTGGIPL